MEGQTRSQLQKIVRRGRVRVGGKRVVRSNVVVQGKVRIEIELEGDEQPAFGLIYEDEHLLVVDKTPGLLTHAADRSRAANLAELLDEEFGPLPRVFGDERPGIVHRLDRETSGVLVVGRTEQAMLGLKEAFRARRVGKTYLALVSHVPLEEGFRIEVPIGPVPGKADRQAVRPPNGGKPAVTEVDVRERFERHALLACHPLTGRRHQIRVHLSERGLPVLGDSLYGTRSAMPLPDGVPNPGRLALHAGSLRFEHPAHKRELNFNAPVPEDLEACLAGLRRGPR